MTHGLSASFSHIKWMVVMRMEHYKPNRTEPNQTKNNLPIDNGNITTSGSFDIAGYFEMVNKITVVYPF
jgi:hypothetical protein